MRDLVQQSNLGHSFCVFSCEEVLENITRKKGREVAQEILDNDIFYGGAILLPNRRQYIFTDDEIKMSDCPTKEDYERAVYVVLVKRGLIPKETIFFGSVG